MSNQQEIEEINLNSFLSALGTESKYTPSEEAFKATEINSVMVKYYLATYYDMKKLGLVTDKVDSLLKDNVQAEAWNVIENCKFSYTLCGDISKNPNYGVKHRLTKDQFDEICEKYGFNLL